MVTTIQLGRNRRGRGEEGHQERPSERLPARPARVRISAPARMNLDTIRVFAISKLGWIKQQQKKLREQERETPPRISGPRKPLRLGKALPAAGDRDAMRRRRWN